MPIDEYIAGASGAALGFIAGDIPGAIIGYKAGRKLTQKKPNMAPSKKRKLITGSAPQLMLTPAGSRRGSNASSASSRRSIGTPTPRRASLTGSANSARSARGGIGGFTNANNVETFVKRQGKNIAGKVKGKKRLKVTRNFRKKVNASLLKSSPSGYYSERFYTKHKFVDHFQAIADLGQGNYAGEFGTDTNGYNFFSPVRVMDAASVLFNNKTAVANKLITDTGNFTSATFECEVIKQWVQIVLKNNSARTVNMKLWTWEFKRGRINAAGVAAEWGSNLTKDASPADGKINLGGVSISTPGATPMLCPGMRERFNWEEKIITLEPGKTYLHYVQGPSKKYSFAKYGYATNFDPNMVGMKGVIMCTQPDVASAQNFGAGNADRITDITSSDSYGILTETIYNYVIKVPEQAGFNLTTATVGTQFPLSMKRSPYFLRAWNDTTAFVTPGPVQEISDENPSGLSAAGV